MQYREAVKFTVKPKLEVRTYVADASNLLGTSKEESQKKAAGWQKVLGKEKFEAAKEAGLIVLDSDDKEASRACRAVYLFARASSRGEFDKKYPEISATDNRTSEDFLKLAREILDAMEPQTEAAPTEAK